MLLMKKKTLVQSERNTLDAFRSLSFSPTLNLVPHQLLQAKYVIFWLVFVDVRLLFDG